MGDKVSLSYEIGGVPTQEIIEAVTRDSTTGLARSFRMTGTCLQPLHLVACEIPGAHSAIQENGVTLLYHSEKQQMVTAVGIINPPKGSSLQARDKRFLALSIPARTPAPMFKVITWTGPVEKLDAFRKMLATNIELGNPRTGGYARWPKPTEVRTKDYPDSSDPYRIEEIPLPDPNPWKRNVRPADIGFFKNGLAATVTFDGDVWLIYGLDQPDNKIFWKRFASGLHEPLALEIADEKIYVLTRNGIIRLHDFNNDKEADYHENFCNLFGQTAETREFANSLAKDPDGGFLLTKGGQQRASQGLHNNHLLHVSADGKKVRKIAYGLRQGFVNAHPYNGRIHATDQQGHYIPTTPVHLVKPNTFLGFREPLHDGKFPPVQEPLCWVPHKVAPSGTHMIWTDPRKFGPLSDRLLLVDYHNPGLLQIFEDLSGKQPQGGVHRLPLTFNAPILKAAVNPVTGNLFLAGLQIFGTKAREIAGIQRIRFTGKPTFLPLDARATDKGILLRFSQPLDLVDATRNDFKGQRWNYKRTKKYGSGHFRMDGKPGQDDLAIANVFLSGDAHSLFIAVPEMKPVHQVEMSFNIKAKNGLKLEDKLWLTPHHLPSFDLKAEKFKLVNLRETLAGAAEGPLRNPGKPSAAAGRKLYTSIGCIGCHTLDGKQAGRPGPSWKGIFNTPRKLADGTTVKANAIYIRKSILDPGSQVLEGFQDNEVAMPPYEGILTDTQVESLMMFIRSL